jgi:hypothetical protein
MCSALSDTEYSALREQICNYADSDAGYGWWTYHDGDKNYQFPYRAMLHYVFGQSPVTAQQLPDYKAFSPPGLKMQNDDPFHSDVWIGAGLAIDTAYAVGYDDNEIFYDARSAFEDAHTNIMTFDFTVLANGLKKSVKAFNFTVYDYDPPLEKGSWSSAHIESAPEAKYDSLLPELSAICIPHAGVEFDLAARHADVIITEKGGKLCHLATLAKESGRILIRVDNATSRFPTFSKLQCSLVRMALEAHQ